MKDTMKKFKPTKELERLYERHCVSVCKAEAIIKERIAKYCRRNNIYYSSFLSIFMDTDNNDIENDKTEELNACIDWFEREFQCIFDPQCIFENGKWL